MRKKNTGKNTGPKPSSLYQMNLKNMLFYDPLTKEHVVNAKTGLTLCGKNYNDTIGDNVTEEWLNHFDTKFSICKMCRKATLRIIEQYK